MTALHIATAEDLERLLPMVEAFHAEAAITTTPEGRRETLETLLAGIPHAVAYLIGPRRAPVGYIVVSFGFSLELGGMDAFVDEFYIREAVRGRGMGSEVLIALLPALSEHGIKAVHLEVERDNARAQKLYQRAGFAPRDKYFLMTREG